MISSFSLATFRRFLGMGLDSSLIEIWSCESTFWIAFCSEVDGTGEGDLALVMAETDLFTRFLISLLMEVGSIASTAADASRILRLNIFQLAEVKDEKVAI